MRRSKPAISCVSAVRYFSEQLGVPFQESISRHLHHCPNCASYLDSLTKIIRLYRSYPVRHPDDPIRSRMDTVVHHLFNYERP